MLGKSVKPWEEVFRTEHELLERTAVVSGWIYRDQLLQGSDSALAHVSMVFVPAGAPLTPVNITAPYVSGVNIEGETLSCTMGTWDNEPTSYAYAWQRGGMTVGTDQNTYTLGPDDVGGSISCIVTATNAAGSTASPPSNAITVS